MSSNNTARRSGRRAAKETGFSCHISAIDDTAMGARMRIRWPRFLRGIALLAISITGCTRKAGSIRGEVFFAGKDGEGKRASAVVVKLLKNPAQFDSSVGAVCARSIEFRAGLLSRRADAEREYSSASMSTADGRQSRMRFARYVVAAHDSAGHHALDLTHWINQVIAANTIDSSITGLEAKYAFSKLPGGEYAVLATGLFGGEPHVWLAKTRVSGSDSTTVNLGTREDRGLAFFCEFDPSDLLTASYAEISRIPADSILFETMGRLDRSAAADRAKDARERAAAEKEYADGLAREAAAKAAYQEHLRQGQDEERSFADRAIPFDKADAKPGLKSNETNSNVHVPGISSGSGIAVRCIVDVDGIPKAIVIETQMAPAAFEAVIAAVSKRRYYPGSKDGKPVPVKLHMILFAE